MVLGGGWGGLGGLRHRTAAEGECTGILETLSKVLETRGRGAQEGMEKCSLRLKDSELRLKSLFSVFLLITNASAWVSNTGFGLQLAFGGHTGEIRGKELVREEPVRPSPCEQCSFWCAHGPTQPTIWPLSMAVIKRLGVH